MEISSIASLSTDMAMSKVQMEAEVAMFKKAMEIESMSAEFLIEALPEIPALPANPNIGRIINTTA